MFWLNFKNNNLSQAREQLQNFKTNGELALEAERDYCLTTLLISSRDDEDRETGKYLLDRLSELKVKEPHIWVKLNFNNIYIKSLEKDNGGAVEVARELENHLISRIDIDSTAMDELNILYRISFSYYPKQLAEMRNSDALKHFLEQYQKGDCKRLDELCRTLNNQATIEIKNNNWEKSKEHLELAFLVHNRSLKNKYINPEFISSNLYLSEFRKGDISATALSSRFDRLIKKNENLLLIANSVSANILANNLEAASDAILNFNETCKYKSIEPFITYLFQTSEAIIEFARGKILEAKNKWGACNNLVEQIPYAASKYYIERHMLLEKAFSEIKPGDIFGFDSYLKGTNTNIPDFYKQGVFLSIILYWSHS